MSPCRQFPTAFPARAGCVGFLSESQPRGDSPGQRPRARVVPNRNNRLLEIHCPAHPTPSGHRIPATWFRRGASPREKFSAHRSRLPGCPKVTSSHPTPLEVGFWEAPASSRHPARENSPLTICEILGSRHADAGPPNPTRILPRYPRVSRGTPARKNSPKHHHISLSCFFRPPGNPTPPGLRISATGCSRHIPAPK